MQLKSLLLLAASLPCIEPETFLAPVAGQPPRVISELPRPEVVIVLDVVVSREGSVVSAHVVCKSSQSRAFARAALHSVSGWTFDFAPEERRGKVVVRYPAHD